MHGQDSPAAPAAPYRITRLASLLVAGVLSITLYFLWQQYQTRQQDFLSHEQQLADRATASVARQIELYIDKERRIARLFAASHATELHTLAGDRQNIPHESALWPLLVDYLPDAQDFTIADTNGEIILNDPQGRIGQACRLDILSYALRQQPGDLFLHVSRDGSHHIDLVEPIANGTSDAHFLVVSLAPDKLLTILREAGPMQHNLLLVRQDKHQVQLASSDEALPPRYHNSRQAVSDDALADTPINGTRWHIVDVMPAAVIDELLASNRRTAILSFTLLLVICVPLLWLVYRQESQRQRSERYLREANDKLKESASRDGELLQQNATTLDYLAAHDTLTGLLNRREFERRLDQALRQAVDAATDSAFCYLDIDQFKVINDTAGHAAGDKLLRQLAELLNDNNHDDGVLARLGSDEFGIILPATSPGDALRYAENLRKQVREHDFEQDGQHYAVSVSIGVVPINQHFSNREGILSAADVATHTAKENGRNQVNLYAPRSADQGEQTTLMKLSRDISLALREDRLELHYQPIQYIGTGEDYVRRFEALVRMQDTYGRVSLPVNFITAAERYGHMPDIDCWVTSRGLEWLENAPTSVFLNINLSGQTIASHEGLNRLSALLDSHPDVLNRLCFEITEGAALINNSRARNFITRIREKGCQVALDDYGSGVFSVSYLRKLPVDVLKIDGELVKTAANDAVALAMVESIARMAHALGIVTVAEHIEDEAVMQKIQSLGIDYGQGFLFGKPGRLDAFSDSDTSGERAIYTSPPGRDKN